VSLHRINIDSDDARDKDAVFAAVRLMFSAGFPLEVIDGFS